ncbi:MAG: hypothetical protein EZS28_000117 [Streblomastix strix]|uniref:Uncharacterized protein n=1 Tax=Streblomastix strix TaxID=222440 RepID=A0A5J4XB22_9EUKA|nr:MAG: hypothetical protein EZS28_000117 [Streblomastix strix]
MKERIIQNKPIKENPTRLASASIEKQMEKLKDYARGIAEIFEQEYFDKITKYNVPTMIMSECNILNIWDCNIRYCGLQQQINVTIEELNRQIHFKGYNLLNTDIKQLENSANGDFAFSAESGTVWMYDQNQYNSGDTVPDQVTPASDATPLADSGTGVAGISNEYSRGDHKHPLQVSIVLPSKDTSVGNIGSDNTCARSDHQYPIYTADTIPVSDSVDGSYGTVAAYARIDHFHPINVQTKAQIVPAVNGIRNNGTSAYYSRHDHIHPQQLTYDGNLIALKFIKTGGLATEILSANGDTKDINGVVDIATDQTITEKKIKKLIQVNPTVDGIYNEGRQISRSINNQWSNIQFGCDPYSNSGFIDNQWIMGTSVDTNINPLCFIISKSGQKFQANKGLQISADENTLTFNGNGFVDVVNDQSISGKKTFACVTSGNIQLNPTATSYDDGLRISRSAPNTANSSIQLGCSRTSNSGVIEGQWTIFTPSSTAINDPYGLIFAMASQAGDNTRGLQISADRNTLSFNGRIL